MIIRTYACTDCNLQWEVTVEDPDAPDPDCPRCSEVLQWVPTRVNIGSVKGKAVDVAQEILEHDFGLSNFNDGNREGDTVFKPPAAPSTGEREAVEREIREYVAQTTTPVAIPVENRAPAGPSTFWDPSRPAAPSIPMQAALAGVKTGPQYPDRNPMSLLQQGIKSGQLASKARIMSRWKP